MIDSHVHLVDFLQRPRHAQQLLDRLDAAGIDRTVVFGLPVRKTWSETEPVEPGYYLDDNAPCYCDLSTDQRVMSLLGALATADRASDRFAGSPPAPPARWSAWPSGDLTVEQVATCLRPCGRS